MPRSHKYIKREGSAGDFKYTYAEKEKALESADKKVESHGNKFDKNPTPENEQKLKDAIHARTEIMIELKKLKASGGGEKKIDPFSKIKKESSPPRKRAEKAKAKAEEIGPDSEDAKELAAADPEFGASEKALKKKLSSKGNPHLEAASEIFNRIKGDLEANRSLSAAHIVQALGEGHKTESEVKAAYEAQRAKFGGDAWGKAKEHFERSTFHTLEEVLSNEPIDIEVERMKRGYPAKQFARMKPYLAPAFVSEHPKAPPPMPTFGDLKGWKEHGAKPDWAGTTRTAVPKEVFDASVKDAEGKPQYPPAWMPIHLMPVWNYVAKSAQTKGGNPYAAPAPNLQGGRISVGTQAKYQEGMIVSALRKYVQMRGGPDQLVNIPSSKLSDVGLEHKDIFKSELSEAELKKLITVKIIDPVELLPFIKEEMEEKEVKKSFELVVDIDEAAVDFRKAYVVEVPETDLRKSKIAMLRKLIHEKSS